VANPSMRQAGASSREVGGRPKSESGADPLETRKHRIEDEEGEDWSFHGAVVFAYAC